MGVLVSAAATVIFKQRNLKDRNEFVSFQGPTGVNGVKGDVGPPGPKVSLSLSSTQTCSPHLFTVPQMHVPQSAEYSRDYLGKQEMQASRVLWERV